MDLGFAFGLNHKKYKCKVKDVKMKFNHKEPEMLDALGLTAEQFKEAHDEAGRFHVWTATGADTRSREIEMFLSLPDIVKAAFYLVVTRALREGAASGGETVAKMIMAENPELPDKLQKAMEDFIQEQESKKKDKPKSKHSSAEDSGIM